MRTAGVTSEMVRALVQHGDLVRLSDDVAFTRTAYEQAGAAVKEAIATTGAVSVAQLRDRLGARRRPMLALLEQLDAAKVTRRVGDARVLRQKYEIERSRSSHRAVGATLPALPAGPP